jgi:hypothetical protein
MGLWARAGPNAAGQNSNGQKVWQAPAGRTEFQTGEKGVSSRLLSSTKTIVQTDPW